MIVDIIVWRAGLIIEERRSGNKVGVLLEHRALLSRHVPDVNGLEVEILGSVLQTAVVAAGGVRHGGAAARRHLAPGGAAGRGLACPRVVRRVSVLDPGI